MKRILENEHSKQLKTLGDPARLQIVLFLVSGEKCVCEIHNHLNLPQNLTSHHLSVLKKHKFIKSHKDGRMVYYSIISETFKGLANCFKKFSGD